MELRSTSDWLHHSELLEAALADADLGWRVFPIRCPVFSESGVRCSCGKKDCKPGKHPHIEKFSSRATTNSNTVKSWWKDWPDANIGIVTGYTSRIVVLDVDPRNGGNESLEKLKQEHGHIPKTVEAISGGRGRHYYFLHPGGEVKSLDNAFGSDFPGLDIRGDRGCIFAPPSLHKSGEKYRWVEGLEPQHTELAPLPVWILERMRSKKAEKTKGKKGRSDQLSQTPIFTEGYRNHSMMRAAGSLNHFCFTETEVFQHLVLFNQNRCEPPLPESEVRSVADSAHKYRSDSPADLLLPVWTPDLPLKSREKSVLSALIKMCDWTTLKCFPSHKTIGDYAGMGTSSVQRALDVLREMGFVSWTHSGRNRSNDYQVHTGRIIQCLTDSKATPPKSTSPPIPPCIDSKSNRPTDLRSGRAEERAESLCDKPDETMSDPLPPDT